MDKQAFLSQVAPGAMEGMRGAKILASLTLAQAILESGWGSSDLASKSFNLFGIKGSGPAGADSYPTQEYTGTEWVTVQADFRKYHDWNESILDHTKLLSGLDRYQNLVGIMDPEIACRLIAKDGYATDPNYPSELLDIIKENDLTKYDSEVLTEADCPDWARGARSLLMGYQITDGTRPNDPVTRAEVWAMLNRLWYVINEQAKEGKSQ